MSEIRLLKQRNVKHAKRNHICDWCDELIFIGDSYIYQFTSEGTWKYHQECFNALNNTFQLYPGDEIEFAAHGQIRGVVSDDHDSNNLKKAKSFVKNLNNKIFILPLGIQIKGDGEIDGRIEVYLKNNANKIILIKEFNESDKAIKT